jgi:hypothetical protein
VDVCNEIAAAGARADVGAAQRRSWWRAVERTQRWLVVAALIGLGSIALTAIGRMFGQPHRSTPELGGIGLPVLLLVGGLGLGLLFAALSTLVARADARMRRRQAEATLRAAITATAQRLVLDPVDAELSRHAAAAEKLEQARTG